MKKLCTIIPALIISGALYAQVPRQPYLKKIEPKKRPGYGMDITGTLPNDSVAAKIREQLKNRLPINGMPNALPQLGIPNAIKIAPAPDVYVGNNGKGQDIYRSQIDNMPILKPDSTFATNIPTINRTYPRYPKAVKVEPKAPAKP